MTYNIFSPFRPTTINDNEPLDHRTHISELSSTYYVYDFTNQLAQMQLYRWCRSLDFVNNVSIADLYDFLFYRYPSVTKRQLGRTVAQTVTYKPTKLKSVTLHNDRPRMMYVWRHREELEYGLEWMLSMWIWRIEYKWKDISRNTDEQHRKMTLKILDDLAALEDDEFHELYAKPLLDPHSIYSDWKLTAKEPDWPSLWARYGLETEGRKQVPRERPTSLRDLSLR